MKSYNHLWENLISDYNIKLAIYAASHGNMKRKLLTEMKNNPEKYYDKVRNWIECYEPKTHTPRQIMAYLSGNLELSVKDNWQVFRFHTWQNRGRFLDFMGFRFYRNRVTLRRKITLKAMRKARRIAKKRKTTVIDARQMLTYKGWTKVTDTYNWLQRYILCFVDFRKLRKIVSNYDKKRRALYVV